MKIIEDKIKDICNRYNLSYDYILNCYNEEHRSYHNINHIYKMLKTAINSNILNYDDLLLAILYHDIVYNPKNNNNNELQSAEIYKQQIGDKFNTNVYNAILGTSENYTGFHGRLVHQIRKLDRSILRTNDFDEFIAYEKGIFKEYQYLDYNVYKTNRIDFLTKNNVDEKYINYVKYFQPKIGIYAGSFNPFHIGHYNILEKAENIFDKVIIAKGINITKINSKIYELPYKISNRQIIEYDGLLTDLIDSFGNDITLIRGLRNATDLQYEQTQYRFMKDLKPDLKMVNIFCDVEYEHISSSSIKVLENYGRDVNKYLLL